MRNDGKSARNSSHSIRTTDELWEMARQRALKDGVTLNFALNELLEGYARGLVALPKVQVTKSYN